MPGSACDHWPVELLDLLFRAENVDYLIEEGESLLKLLTALSFNTLLEIADFKVFYALCQIMTPIFFMNSRLIFFLMPLNSGIIVSF